jgi:hypothetical protein
MRDYKLIIWDSVFFIPNALSIAVFLVHRSWPLWFAAVRLIASSFFDFCGFGGVLMGVQRFQENELSLYHQN